MSRVLSLLTVEEHSRDSAGMTYVYPVVSRRARGVSIGINLNPNNACNWQCAYCQVPDLTRGGPPPIDLAVLKRELEAFIEPQALERFMCDQVPPDSRLLQDISFSGNGEPTTAREFPRAVELVVGVLRTHGLDKLKVRLITNGSQVEKGLVKEGLRQLAAANGEVWFKLDAATARGIAAINGTRLSPEAHLRRLKLCAELCPTWVQSCFFSVDGQEPSTSDIDCYIAALAGVADRLAGVHLYGLARPSLQPGGKCLGRLPQAWFNTLAEPLRRQGLKVVVNP